MSNSVQRMAKAGENIRKLGFCMAAVFAGMLVAFAALVVYVIWYAVANVVSVDSFGVVTLLNGGSIVIPSGLCLALAVGVSLVVLCGISHNISRGVSPFTKALPLMRGRLSAQLSVCLSRRSGVMPRCSKSSLTSLCRRKHELSHHRA